MNKLLTKLCASVMLALTVSACGGSSGGSGTSGATDNSNPSYTGNRNAVLLKPDNTVHFARALLGFEALFLFRNTNVDPTKTNEPTRSWGLLAFSNLMNQILEDSQATEYHQRTETRWCGNSGTVDVTGEPMFVEGVGNGAQTHLFKNCQSRPEGVVLNGMMSVTQEKTLDSGTLVEKKRVEFSGLEVIMSGQRYVYTGSQDLEKSYFDRPQFPLPLLSLTASMNITERNPNNNKTNMLENVEIAYSRDGPDQIKGRLYEHDLGYISLSGTNDLELSKYFTLMTHSDLVLLSRIPIAGSILLNGASRSKAKVELVNYSEDAITSGVTASYLISLDQDGDGVFEIRSIQNDQAIHHGVPGEFVEQYQPVAKIDWEGNNDDLLPGATVELSGEASSDPDTAFSESLKYFWTLESKPEGSNAGLSAIMGEKTTFNPDVYGVYEVSLKVTDYDGNSALSTKRFHLADRPPSIRFSGYQAGNYVLELGDKLRLSAWVSDLEDSRDTVAQYEFEWGLQKPQGSQSLLQDVDRSHASLKADKTGNYVISYKTIDSQSNVTTEFLSFTVINSPPVAVISNHQDFLAVIVNKPRMLHSLSEDPGTSGFDLLHHWELIDKPVGSKAGLINQNMYSNVIFTPDLMGRYRIRLTVTDPYGKSDSVEKDFVAIES